MWEIKEHGRGYRNMRDEKSVEEAYECGYEDGYEDAMKEMKEDDDRSYRMSSRSYRGSMRRY
jgi:flagellar biosynthesis/type III secretory pathway protein FliH